MDHRLAVAPAQSANDDVLRMMAHAFGSATDQEEAVGSTVRWLTEAGEGGATVRLFLAENGGRLRPAGPNRMSAAGGGGRSAPRYEAFRTKRPALIRVRRPSGHAVAVLPLISRGVSLGVVEVSGPRGLLEDRWDLLEAVTSQAAILFRNLRRQRELEQRVGALEHATGLALALVGAASSEQAVKEAVSFCYERFGAPVVGWLDRGGETMAAAAVRGVGAARAQRMRSQIPAVPRWDGMEETERDAIVRRIEELLGTERTSVVEAGASVLMLGGIDNSVGLETVGHLLREALEHLKVVDLARQRNEALDLGIALTAHEVRGPLVGARAVIEGLLRAGEIDGGAAEHLEDARRELQELTELVGALMSWSVGRRRLELRDIDLIEVMREAIESCELQPGGCRIVLRGSAGLPIRADRRHLRTGVANVIRNALTYSPPDAEVEVRVQRRNGSAVITVADQGPGIPEDERESIFDPFVRGRAAVRRTGRAGLGLFVARRVIEAHQGDIRVAQAEGGAAFRIRLPADRAS